MPLPVLVLVVVPLIAQRIPKKLLVRRVHGQLIYMALNILSVCSVRYAATVFALFFLAQLFYYFIIVSLISNFIFFFASLLFFSSTIFSSFSAYIFYFLNFDHFLDMLPSLLSVSNSGDKIIAESGEEIEIEYMSEVKRALGEFTIIFNELLRYVRSCVT